uniref:Histidinol-phosphate aminotransferase n=1 Tax=Anthurium amnicola TaxID=1678845 RepID=A0A1D1Y760_9ARAE
MNIDLTCILSFLEKHLGDCVIISRRITYEGKAPPPSSSDAMRSNIIFYYLFYKNLVCRRTFKNSYQYNISYTSVSGCRFQSDRAKLLRSPQNSFQQISALEKKVL